MMSGMSDWRKLIVSDDAALGRILKAARTIAVLGAKAQANQPAYYVPAYLAARGYRLGMVSRSPGVGAERVLSYPGVEEYGVTGSPVIEPGEM